MLLQPRCETGVTGGLIIRSAHTIIGTVVEVTRHNCPMFIEELNRHLTVSSIPELPRVLEFDKNFWNVVLIREPRVPKPDCLRNAKRYLEVFLRIVPGLHRLPMKPDRGSLPRQPWKDVTRLPVVSDSATDNLISPQLDDVISLVANASGPSSGQSKRCQTQIYDRKS